MTANSKRWLRLVGRITLIIGVMAVCFYVAGIDLVYGLAALIVLDGRRGAGIL